MNHEPKDGDFARLVNQPVRVPAPSQGLAWAATPTETSPTAPGMSWAKRWEPVLLFVSQQRFRLMGLMATATVAVAAALVALTALVIKTESPVSAFVLNVVVQSSFSQIILDGVQTHYRTSVIEAAEEFQATGQAPPGVSVTQNGSITEVDTEAIKARMPLREVMLGAALVALAFAVAAGVIFQQLRAVAPSAVTPRRLWLATAVLVLLEAWAYSLQGVWGLSLLLLAVGGVSAGLLWLLQQWPKIVDMIPPEVPSEIQSKTQSKTKR